MRTVVHETPGLIDLRAFTTFGVNAKPNSENPIGFFGTGLKYAVAVLVREGVPVTVWVGEEPHVFYGSETRFRDRDFLQVRMRRQRGVTARWMSTELPFTTDLGKNWELWMALRELHSNTLDEGGTSYSSEISGEGEMVDIGNDVLYGRSGHTRIVVQGDAYADAFSRLSEIFLPDAEPAPFRVQCVDRPSKHAYYRGLRAYDLPHEAIFTWNVTWPLTLTEDRTLRLPFMVEHYVAGHVMGSTDAELIRRVLQAPEDSFEGRISWENQDTHTVTPEFVEGARRYGRPKVQYVVAREDRRRAAAELPRDDWRTVVLSALDSMREDDISRLCLEHRAELAILLRADLQRVPPTAPEVVPLAGTPVAVNEDDGMPF